MALSAYFAAGGEALWWRPYGSEITSADWGFGVWGQAGWGRDCAAVHYRHINFGNEIRYRNLTFRAGHEFQKLYAFVAGKYLYVEEKPHTFEGGAPQVGIGAKSCRLFGMGLFAEVSLAAAIGKQDTHIQCLPWLAFNFGGSYLHCIGPIQLEGQIGYTFEYLFSFRRTTELNQNQLTIRESNIGFGGLFIAGRIRY